MPDIRGTLGIEDVDMETVPSTVDEYSKGIASTKAADDYSLVKDTIDFAYNVPKTVADYALQTIPAAEAVLNPIGEYSGFYDYFKTLGSTELEGKDFIKISKNQIDNPEIIQYLENYKNDYALDEGKVIDHLNKQLGLNVVNIQDLVSKYKGNQEVSDAASNEIKKIEKDFLTDNDWTEDEDFYYIKNFKEVPMGVNLAWTQQGDLQMPNLGIFKFDADGQGSMMRTSATNIRGSSIPGVSWIGDQGFGSKPEHEYGLELYGSPGAQIGGELMGSVASLAAANPSGIAAAPGIWNKIKTGAKSIVPGMPKTAKSRAITGGIASVPAAGYFNVFGQ
tara:strand:- start:2696 stop:3700 length:1005 start_codon:yes stop_codon:yes gene_type:complete